MIPTVFGISLIAHLVIISAGKTRKLCDKFLCKKNNLKTRQNTTDKVLTSLAIATFTELAALMIIVSAFNVLVIGLESEKSNYKIIQQAFYEFKNKSISIECLFNEKCGIDPPDANIPLG